MGADEAPDDFSSLQASSLTLLVTLLADGAHALEEADESIHAWKYGYVMWMLFALFGITLLMNLLISMMVDKYTEVQENSAAQWSHFKAGVVFHHALLPKWPLPFNIPFMLLKIITDLGYIVVDRLHYFNLPNDGGNTEDTDANNQPKEDQATEQIGCAEDWLYVEPRKTKKFFGFDWYAPRFERLRWSHMSVAKHAREFSALAASEQRLKNTEMCRLILRRLHNVKRQAQDAQAMAHSDGFA